MKIFEMYSQDNGSVNRYLVLKCNRVECGLIFRFLVKTKMFGREIKNAKCQHCNHLISIDECSQDCDPLYYPIKGNFIRKEIVNDIIIAEYPFNWKADYEVAFSSADKLE